MMGIAGRCVGCGSSARPTVHPWRSFELAICQECATLASCGWAARERRVREAVGSRKPRLTPTEPTPNEPTK